MGNLLMLGLQQLPLSFHQLLQYGNRQWVTPQVIQPTTKTTDSCPCLFSTISIQLVDFNFPKFLELVLFRFNKRIQRIDNKALTVIGFVIVKFYGDREIAQVLGELFPCLLLPL